MPSISVVTPSVRHDLLPIVKKCLDRQIFRDFEWIVVSPTEYPDALWVQDPPKREGDFWTLQQARNKAYSKTQGSLIVSIEDGIWFPPYLLERLWDHYIDNPKGLVSCIGHQYDQITHGKPEHMVWRDPRCRTDFGAFYEVSPVELEFCVASIPKQAFLDTGGFDEEFDKYCGLAEKEMCYRLDTMGYRFFLDQTLEYRAIHHPRLSGDWDKHYEQGCVYYQSCLTQIGEGERQRLDFLSRTGITEVQAGF